RYGSSVTATSYNGGCLFERGTYISTCSLRPVTFFKSALGEAPHTRLRKLIGGSAAYEKAGRASRHAIDAAIVPLALRIALLRRKVPWRSDAVSSLTEAKPSQ